MLSNRWKKWLLRLDPLSSWFNREPKTSGSGMRIWATLRRHRLALWGARILALLYMVVLFADVLAPYPYDYNQKKKSWHKPTPLLFGDSNGFSLQPFIYEYKIEFDENQQRNFVPVSLKRHHLTLFPKVVPRKFMGLWTIEHTLLGIHHVDGVMFYPLGADAEGRDILSRILYGGRVSLSVGLVGVMISFTLGMLVGGISGYFGGWVDIVLMRLSEMIMMTPGFYLMLALRASFPDDVSSTAIYLLIVIIMSFIGWAGLARVIRGMVLSIKKQTYVESARAMGASHLYIIVRHILPATFSYAIVAATLSIPGYILGESALSLLTLGIQEPEASWGNMLTAARNITSLQLYPWILWPGFFIFLTVMSYNFLGDGLRDALDPLGDNKSD